MENDLAEVKIYPNPTSGELRILMNNEQLIMNNVEVFDVYGKNVLSNHLINISHLQTGVYFVRIATEQGVVMRKVVKR
ncbi:MAG: T9SS type A sorting domain-containing protein [Bacteroidetes bacterium]|nr:T9SS type A sorting domain-containing protein [Bacteroidota bacterium]MCL1968252.1 T9SS type A sorting domain-containing protein [Bacteroidota bacterium]